MFHRLWRSSHSWRGKGRPFGIAATAALALALPLHAQSYSITSADYDEECGVQYSTDQQLTNWSSTHSCVPVRLYEPQSAQECIRLLQTFHKRKQKIRVVGTALSPNGLGLASAGTADCMLSVAGRCWVAACVTLNFACALWHACS